MITDNILSFKKAHDMKGKNAGVYRLSKDEARELTVLLSKQDYFQYRFEAECALMAGVDSAIREFIINHVDRVFGVSTFPDWQEFKSSSYCY